MPELLFTALLLASVILAERAMQPEAPRWLAVAGGHLRARWRTWPSRSRLPLLLTVPLCFAAAQAVPQGRAVLRRDAARRRGMAMVGGAAPDAILGSGDAVLHQLHRLSNLQCSAARSAAGDLVQPGRLPAGGGEAADLRPAVWLEASGARGCDCRHRRMRSPGAADASAAISAGRAGNVGDSAGVAFPARSALRFSAVSALADGLGHGGSQHLRSIAARLGETSVCGSFRGGRIRRASGRPGRVWDFLHRFRAGRMSSRIYSRLIEAISKRASEPTDGSIAMFPATPMCTPTRIR